MPNGTTLLKKQQQGQHLSKFGQYSNKTKNNKDQRTSSETFLIGLFLWHCFVVWKQRSSEKWIGKQDGDADGVACSLHHLRLRVGRASNEVAQQQILQPPAAVFNKKLTNVRN